MSNIINFFSKYYNSINKQKIFHSIVNFLIAIIIFIIFYVLAKIVFNKIKNANVKKILKEDKKDDNLSIPKPNPQDSKIFSQLHKKIFAQFIYYSLIFIGIIFAISKLGINVNSILIILGTIGVGLAFGFQNFIKEIVSGISILALNYFNLGDLIKVNDNIGYVKKFNLANTTISTNFGESIIIPNSLISSDSLTNITKNKSIFVMIPAVLSNTKKIDYPKLLKKIEEKVKSSKYIIDKNEVVATVRDMARLIDSGEAGTTIGVKAKIESANYFAAMNDIRLILRQTLEDENIRLFDYYS
jgi:small conductance mechanosensitive channel